MENRGIPLLLAVIFGSLASLAIVILVAVIMTLLGYEDTEPLAWIIGQVSLWVYFTWLLRNHSPWADRSTDNRRVSVPVKDKKSSPPS
jgi:hypothetical protein